MAASELSKEHRQPGIGSRSVSTAKYPNAVFALERRGAVAYERFAYNALSMGTGILNQFGFHDVMSVDLSGMMGADPWSLGAQIHRSTSGSGKVHEHRIETTPFTPLVLNGLAVSLAKVFGPEDQDSKPVSQPQLLHAELEHVAESLAVAITACRRRGLGPALLELRDRLVPDFDALLKSLNYFDSAAQFLIGHELAHVYLERFDWTQESPPEEDRRAYEILADLLSASWLFEKLVVKTPDSDRYRSRRGFSDYKESIRRNADWALYSHLTVLAFFALSGVIRAGDRVALEGGLIHPHALFRYYLQDAHMVTLVLSNFGQFFDDEQRERFLERPLAVLRLFVESGLIPLEDLHVLTESKRYRDVHRAAELLEGCEIAELQGPKNFLGDFTVPVVRTETDPKTPE